MSDRSEFTERLARAAERLEAAGLDALLLTPGANLRYLTGYDALALERLTCLLVPRVGEALLLVPELERPAAELAPAVRGGVALRAWSEPGDPYALLAEELSSRVSARRAACDDETSAAQLFALQRALPDVEWSLASALLSPLRRVKSQAEVESLARAGAAIDAVHVEIARWLRPGRSEWAVARDLEVAIRDAGHARTEFVIVASGPHAASPHHRPGERLLRAGDVVIVDIGGTMPDGYCSDSTRTYALGSPPSEFLAYYDVLRRAQEAGVAAVRPGVSRGSVDAACRDAITDAGYGEYFTHRTGHGIGLQTHEEPYLVAGASQPLEEGEAFSIEPGIYMLGLHGARIEDIVVCTSRGARLLNQRPRELVVL